MNIGKIYDIRLCEIITNPHQPREFFNEDSLLELADSIGQHGLLQPVVVRINDEKNYELIAGERRLRAFELLGKETIPAIVTEYNSKDSAILAIIENVQRDDLHFIEVAKGYKKLMNDYILTQSELVSIVGKSQSAIANKLRILNLYPSTISLILDSNLTERHCRALLKITDENMQHKVVQYMLKHELNVKQTEDYIEKIATPKTKKNQQAKTQVVSFVKDIRLFTNTIKQAVDSINSAGLEATYTVREENDKYTITIDIPIEK